ncbi:unnamed protein product, partial [Ixodes hexagonus]
MSFARARFAIDARLLALAGCFFQQPNDSLNASIALCCHVYAVACVCTAVALEVCAYVGRSTSHPRIPRRFNSTLFLVIRVVFFVKLVSLRMFLRRASTRIEKLIAQASGYEESRNIQVKYRCPSLKTAYRWLSFLAVTCFFTSRWHVFVRTLYAKTPLPVKAFLDFLTLLSASCMAVWDSIHNVLVKYFAEVFTEYLKAENVVLTAVAQRKVVGFSGVMNTILSRVRSNYEEIFEMVVAARSVIGLVVLFGFTCNVVILCAVLYSYTDNTTTISLLLSGTFYAVHVIADTLNVVFAVETLASEVK